MKVDMARASPGSWDRLAAPVDMVSPPQREQPLLLSRHGVVDSVVLLSRHK